MFHEISKDILHRMKTLEEIDKNDRQDGTPQSKRLRQIPPETGRFLAMQAAQVPEGAWLEIGTSAGYSALWISLAAKERGTKLITFELLPEKVALASETFKLSKVEPYIDLINGDARGHIDQYAEIAFAFLDAEKEMYQEFYDLIAPRLVKGGLLIADNLISHENYLAEFMANIEADKEVDALLVPIGKGLLLVRKV